MSVVQYITGVGSTVRHWYWYIGKFICVLNILQHCSSVLSFIYTAISLSINTKSTAQNNVLTFTAAILFQNGRTTIGWEPDYTEYAFPYVHTMEENTMLASEAKACTQLIGLGVCRGVCVCALYNYACICSMCLYKMFPKPNRKYPIARLTGSILTQPESVVAYTGWTKLDQSGFQKDKNVSLCFPSNVAYG